MFVACLHCRVNHKTFVTHCVCTYIHTVWHFCSIRCEPLDRAKLLDRVVDDVNLHLDRVTLTYSWSIYPFFNVLIVFFEMHTPFHGRLFLCKFHQLQDKLEQIDHFNKMGWGLGCKTFVLLANLVPEHKNLVLLLCFLGHNTDKRCPTVIGSSTLQ